MSSADGAADGRRPHAAGDDRGVAHQPTARSEDALGRDHAVQVVGRGLGAHEDHALAVGVVRLRGVRGEVDLADRRARGRVQSLGDRRVLRARVELRVEELVELRRLHAQHRLPAVDEALALHLDGHPQRGGRGALADARLQDEEATLFDGELDVAHVAEVVLQRAHHLEQLGVALREVVRHGVERFGDTDTGDDVLALGVGEEVPVRAVLAGRGVAGERDAGAGVVALVAEDHRLDVDGGAEVVGDALELAVVAGAPSVPRTEHRLDRVPQLLVGILREVDAGVGLDDVLERLDESLADRSPRVRDRSRRRARRAASRAPPRSGHRRCRARSCRTSARTGGRSRTRTARWRSAWRGPAPRRR